MAETKKRPRRVLGEPAPILDEAEPARAESTEVNADLRAEIEARLSALESRVDGGMKDLEQKVSTTLKHARGGDAEEVRDEIKRAMEDFEKKVLGNLHEARSKGDKSRAGLMERVLTVAGSLNELLNPDSWRETWSKYALRGKSEVVDDYGMDPIIAQRFKPLLDFLYYEYWRVETRGINNIPTEGSGLVVSNHSGGLPYDGAMIKAAVMNEQPQARDLRFLVEDFAYHFPYLGTMMMRIGGVRASPENAVRLLRHGELVCVFPEGVKGLGKLYKQRYRLQRFGRGGFVKICLDTKAPLIPASVVGAEEIHPMIGRAGWIADIIGVPYLPITPTFPWLGLLGMIPLPSKWTITFAEPIDFSGFTDDRRKNRILVNKLSQQVRGQIQSMIMEQLKERRSVWFG